MLDLMGTPRGLAAAAWAKSDRTDPTAWLPLTVHLEDTAQVAARLWDDWLPGAVRDRVDEALPDAARDGRALVAFLGAVHDTGKLTPAFQCKVPHLAERVRAVGVEVPAALDAASHRMSRHALAGQLALDDWLQDLHGRSGRWMGEVVGAHHGTPSTPLEMSELRARPHLLGSGPWDEARRALLQHGATNTGAERYLPSWVAHRVPHDVTMLLTGIVIVADWIASNADHFPLWGPGDVLEDSSSRARLGLRALDLPRPWRAHAADAVDLGQRFPRLEGHELRPVQRAAVDAARALPEPGLIIVEAPPGCGKTEGALLAAEVLAEKFSLGGVFLGLPTMATSDAMFDRVREWVDHLPGADASSMYLAHGRWRLNESFQGLLQTSSVVGVGIDEDGGPDPRTVTAIARSWLTGRKRGMLANVVVGTIDQALVSALVSKHLMLRHLALAGKVVILDEVHAADDHMRQFLTRALTWLARYRVPVILLSATLPPGQRAELEAAYAAGAQHEPAPEDGAPYPLVSSITRAGQVTRTAPEPDGRRAQVALRLLPDESIVETVLDLSASGGCVGVVCNTVGRAQTIYQQLRDALGPEDVTLVHSRFLGTHRAAREESLRRRLGPPGAGERPDRLVVVGTQVLEQSLDIDLDLLVTDLAPADLVIQRLGRLHRHERDRPEPLRDPVAYVTGMTLHDGTAPTFEKGSRAVYSTARLLRAAIALGLTSGNPGCVRMPDDIRRVVDAAYAVSPTAPVGWEDALETADAAWDRERQESIHRASTFRLPEPTTGRLATLASLFAAGRTTDDDARGYATVRDGEGSVEVLVVQRRAGGLWTVPAPGGQERQLPEHLGRPEPAAAREIAASVLRLPLALTHPGIVDTVIEELERCGVAGWQEDPLLGGQLILVLDDELAAVVAKHEVRYDEELGLLVGNGGAQ